MIFGMVFHFFLNQNHRFDELDFINQNDVLGGAKCRRTIGNSIFYSKNTNFKTHRVIANDDFLTKKDRLGSHRTIGNYRFLTKKGTPSGANCELNPHTRWSPDPPGTPAGSSFPIENHRSAGAADADYPRDADCVAGPYIPRRKERREVPYLP